MTDFSVRNDIEWRQCYGFPDYEVSNYGDLRRLTYGGRRYPAGYVLKPKRHNAGYVCFTLAHRGLPRTMLQHRLVALTFLGEPPTPEHEVAHNDGCRTHNHVSNLRWATPTENQADRKAHGTYMAGEVCTWTVKLTDRAVAEIREAYARGGKRYAGGSVTMSALAVTHGVSPAQISRIVNERQRVGV